MKNETVPGKIHFLRSADFWAKLLSEVMDFFAYVAIFIAGEVQSWPILVAVGMSVLRLASRMRFRGIWMVLGFLFQIFLAVLLSLRMQMHPIVAVAHVAPIALAWIGFARGSEALWGWRMGLGFIALILASSLSPDFSVTLLILSFIISGSMAIACRFLSEEYARRGVIGSLPRGFVRNSFKQTGILFLAALIIFPLIPRVQGRGGGGFGNDPAKTGYTEEVNLSEWSRLSARGSEATALRIYGPEGADPNHFIPGGLLRSRVLSILAIDRWDPAPSRAEPYLDPRSLKNTSGTLRITREMQGNTALPVPYGTLSAQVELYGYTWPAERTAFSEWREARSRNQRFNYLTIVSLDARSPQDKPRASDVRVPEGFKSERMKALANRLFKGTKDSEAKIRAVQSFFQREGFRAMYLEDEAPKKISSEDEKLPPIERFLFVEKAGHCELFASSMAILLRLGGVPSRLVAGFRVSRDAIGDVLTVRQSDAHAWVETFVPGAGWKVYDPTPRILKIVSLTDWARDSYDWASAKWTQYILNYGDGETSMRAQWESLKKLSNSMASGKNPLKDAESDASAYLFVVVFGVIAIGFSIFGITLSRSLRLRKKKRDSAWIRTLRKERARFERSASQALPLEAKEWIARYERARFGAVEIDKQDELLTDLQNRRAEIERRV